GRDAADAPFLAELTDRCFLDALSDGDTDHEQERAGDHSTEREQSADLVLPQSRQGEAEQIAETHASSSPARASFPNQFTTKLAEQTNRVEYSEGSGGRKRTC